MKKTVAFCAVFSVLIIVAIINLSGVLSASDYRSTAPTETGVFDAFNSLNAADIEQNIREAEQKRLEQQEVQEVLDEVDSDDLNLRKIFADTCFVGDSLMNGLEVYEILNSDMLMTQVSASLDHLYDCVDSIIATNPQNLILHYGINMLSEYDEGKDSFIEYYSEIITDIKKSLPATRIIVSSIFSVDPEAEMEEIFDRIPAYNKALSDMCVKLGVEFLDSTQLLSESVDYYSGDGIHLEPSFYSERWLPFIVENKGIVG